MATVQILSCDSKDEWLGTIQGAVFHDFYHLPFYHSLAGNLGEGEPYLFVYKNGEYVISLPFLIRQIDCGPALNGNNKPWYDVTSVYGYAGPVASHVTIPDTIAADFREALTGTLQTMRVVSLFSRLHPFFDQTYIVSGLGKIVNHGETVSIDLNIPEQSQTAQYRENHRRGIRKLIDMGATCVIDEEFRYLDEFIGMYNATMSRVHASEEYAFTRSYFEEFIATKEAETRLLVCSIRGELACAGLFVHCGNILEYHLGGTSPVFLDLSPMKLVMDRARHWGHEHGAKIFHLGGGVGSHLDSLFHFKCGFSKKRHQFRTWRWILSEEIYKRLSTTGTVSPDNSNPASMETGFFPAYRARALEGIRKDRK